MDRAQIIRGLIDGLNFKAGVGAAFTRIDSRMNRSITTDTSVVTIPFTGSAFYPSVAVSGDGSFQFAEWDRYAFSAGIGGNLGFSGTHFVKGVAGFAQVARGSHYDQYTVFLRGGAAYLGVAPDFEGGIAQTDPAALIALGIHGKLSPNWGICLEGNTNIGKDGLVQASGTFGITWHPGNHKTAADKLAQTAEEKLYFAEGAIRSLVQFSETIVHDFSIIVGTTLDVESASTTLGDYVQWLTAPNATWTIGEPHRSPYATLKFAINDAVDLAQSVTYSDRSKVIISQKIRDDIAKLNDVMAQPVLRVLYTDPFSILDHLQKTAGKIDEALKGKNATNAQQLISHYAEVLETTKKLGDQIKPFMSARRRRDTDHYRSRVDCLVRNSMCPDSETQNQSLPVFQSRLNNLVAEQAAPANTPDASKAKTGGSK